MFPKAEILIMCDSQANIGQIHAAPSKQLSPRETGCGKTRHLRTIDKDSMAYNNSNEKNQ